MAIDNIKRTYREYRYRSTGEEPCPKRGNLGKLNPGVHLPYLVLGEEKIYEGR